MGCCELADKTTEELYKVSTPCIDDHQIKEELKISGRIVKRMFTNCLEHVCFGDELVDLIYSKGQSTNLHVRSQSGTELVTNV